MNKSLCGLQIESLEEKVINKSGIFSIKKGWFQRR